MNKLAFTLAEVLITLGIIGVVAAMTLPTLVKDIQGQERQAQLKAGYSILIQGLKNMQAENGYAVVPAHYDRGASFYPEYKKGFNKIFDCGVVPLNSDLCMSRANTQNDTSPFNTDLVYKTLNGNNMSTDYFDDGQFILSNGMLVMIDNCPGTSYILLSIDLNGKSNSPNRLGQDLFTFQLMPDGNLLPMGASGTHYESQATYCSFSSSSNLNGIGCTYKALTDKTYWKNLKNKSL